MTFENINKITIWKNGECIKEFDKNDSESADEFAKSLYRVEPAAKIEKKYIINRSSHKKRLVQGNKTNTTKWEGY